METRRGKESGGVIGPYRVLESLQASPEGHGCWALTRSCSAAFGSASCRSEPRRFPRCCGDWDAPADLRWLSGRRSAEENWDAYEAVAGRPLLELLPECPPWSQCAFWLLDLAKELLQGEAEGSVPGVLSLDRVWIATDGTAKLLDFPVLAWLRTRTAQSNRKWRSPAVPSTAAGRQTRELRFLSDLARSLLRGQGSSAALTELGIPAVPLPLQARTFLCRLPELPGMAAVVARSRPSCTRQRRCLDSSPVSVLGEWLFPLSGAIGMGFALHWIAMSEQQHPGLFELSQLLQVHASQRLPWTGRIDQPRIGS